MSSVLSAASGSHSRREGHSMLLGNPHIEKTLGEPFRKSRQSGPRRHRRRNRRQLRMRFRQLRQRLSERPRKGHASRPAQPQRRIERRHSMITLGGLRRRGITMSFFCNHVYDNRPPRIPGRRQQPDQIRNRMSVHRPQITDAELFKQSAGQKNAFRRLLNLLNGTI